MHAVHFATEFITNLGPKLWKLVPDKLKNTSKLSVFKSKIKTWTTDNYPVTLNKTLIKNLGFVEVCPSL